MAVNDVFQVDFRMTSDDRLVQTAHYYVETLISTGSQAEVTEAICLAAEIDFWTDFWKPFCSLDVLYHSTQCQQIYPTRQAPFISTLLASEAGAGLGAAMNGTTAVLAALYGQKWEAAFRGRAYIPGMQESDVEGGRILAAQLASIQASANTFYQTTISPGGAAGGSYSSAVVSPTKIKALDEPVWDFVNTVTVRPRIATQRRRRTNIQAAA